MSRAVAVRNALLTSVAWTGLVLYILGCVSWSPDGSKLVYPYINPEADESGVAIFERGGEKANVLYLSQASDDLTLAQWEREGKRIILFVGESEILRLPLDGSRPVRRLELPADVDSACFPAPEVDGNLFFSGDHLVRVNLETGETTVKDEPDEEEMRLFQAGNGVIYLRKLDEGYEVGGLDLESLELERRFLIPTSSLKEHGIEQLSVMEFDSRSQRIAVTVDGAHDGGVLLLGESGLERVLVPRTTEPRFHLGNLQWSSEGQLLYAAMVSPRDDGNSVQAFVAEVALADGATRILPIARLNTSDTDIVLLLQVALSPDGNQIAVSTAALAAHDVAPEDRGLYLVDLRDFGSYVQFVPLPEPANEPRSKEGG